MLPVRWPHIAVRKRTVGPTTMALLASVRFTCESRRSPAWCLQRACRIDPTEHCPTTSAAAIRLPPTCDRMPRLREHVPELASCDEEYEPGGICAILKQELGREPDDRQFPF